MKINVKRLDENATMPTRGSDYAAGYDLYANLTESVEIRPYKTQKIGTGLSFEIPEGYFGAVFARSGLATKQDLNLANSVGVIDSDYRGELIVPLHNIGVESRTVQNGDRIAQLVILPCSSIEFNEVDELSETVRANGGFGSTGINTSTES